MAKRIAIGADHGGYALKEALKRVIEKEGYGVLDVGTFSAEPCDYPEFGYKVAAAVAEKKAVAGVAICKTGIGMAIVANKVPGVRAGLCLSAEDALSARRHNDANVLVVSANKTCEAEAVPMVRNFLSTPAEKGRHARRVQQISDIEKKFFKKIRKKGQGKSKEKK